MKYVALTTKSTFVLMDWTPSVFPRINGRTPFLFYVFLSILKMVDVSIPTILIFLE